MILSTISSEKISHAENENQSVTAIKAKHMDDVEIQDIQVHPSQLAVGDDFRITATLVNNSPVPIRIITSDDCEGSFTVKFDNHVTVNHSNLTCAYKLTSKSINPGGKITKTSPGPILDFRAATAGTGWATIVTP